MKEKSEKNTIEYDEFYSNLTEQNNYTKEKVEQLYQTITNILKLLKTVRMSEFKTIKILDQQTQQLSDYDKTLVEHWLFKAISNDDTFCYAYNFFAKKVNQEEGYAACPIKVISYTDLSKLLEKENEQNNKEKQTALPLQNVRKDIKKAELTINQIALIYCYEGKQITRDNSNEIAKQYNHNSGEKLFHRYTYFSSTANRKGRPTPCTHKKLKNKIELFESIVNHLSDNAKQRAIDEIKILKALSENEY